MNEVRKFSNLEDEILKVNKKKLKKEKEVAFNKNDDRHNDNNGSNSNKSIFNF